MLYVALSLGRPARYNGANLRCLVFVVKVFDVLYARRKNAAGTSCLELPLWKRKYLLSTLFTPKKGVIELADCVRAESKEDIKGYLEKIVAERSVSSFAFFLIL